MLIENGILKSIDENDIVDGKLVIPEGVIEIAERALLNCQSLISVEFPESLIKIAMRAFAFCENLGSVKFSENLKEIGQQAFFGCTGLREIIFNTSLEVIGREAFSECESLQIVNLPEGLKDIGYAAFTFCKDLREISFPESLKFINTPFEKREVKSAEDLLSFTLNYHGNIESIQLPNFLERLESKEGYIFLSLCEKLEKVNIPINVASVMEYTFLGSKSIEEISLSKNTRWGRKFIQPKKVIYVEIEEALRERGVSPLLIDQVATQINPMDFQGIISLSQYKDRIMAWCERGVVPSWEVFSAIPLERIDEFKNDMWNEFINNQAVQDLGMDESGLIKLAFVFGIFDDTTTVTTFNDGNKKSVFSDAKARMNCLINWIQTRCFGC